MDDVFAIFPHNFPLFQLFDCTGPIRDLWAPPGPPPSWPVASSAWWRSVAKTFRKELPGSNWVPATHILGMGRDMTWHSVISMVMFWLVVWNINFIFPSIGNNHANWRSYFSEGFKPPTRYGDVSLIRKNHLQIPGDFFLCDNWWNRKINTASMTLKHRGTKRGM